MQQITDSNLEYHVQNQSPVSQAELISSYQGADLFASTSFEEGLGLTYLEAMAGEIVALGEQMTERFAYALSRRCLETDLRRAAGSAARECFLAAFSEQVTTRRLIDSIAEAAGS